MIVLIATKARHREELRGAGEESSMQFLAKYDNNRVVLLNFRLLVAISIFHKTSCMLVRFSNTKGWSSREHKMFRKICSETSVGLQHLVNVGTFYT